MHKTSEDVEAYFSELSASFSEEGVKVYLAVPATCLERCALLAQQTPFVVGAQNMHEAAEGAFTGEVSASMLRASGARFVLIGHSERRHLFGESDDQVHQKVCGALEAGLQPILCVGETLQQREEGLTEQVLSLQLEKGLFQIPSEAMAQLIIAYEPVWAIGTGKTASPEEAQAVHQFIRGWLESQFGSSVASVVVIQYGGSVKPENAADLMCQKDIDGVLVGGASLKAETFAKIANCDLTVS